MAWKKWVLAIVWALALIGWAGVAGFYFTDPSIQEWTVAVTAAAILTEVAFWATAGLLGLTLWESRKRVIGFLARPFRKDARS